MLLKESQKGSLAMQDSDFNSVEAELREIEKEFASGRMNAFGTASTQESFIRELKRIADIETQIFYRTCAIIKSSTEEDHSLLTTIFASATAGDSQGGVGDHMVGSTSATANGAQGFRNGNPSFSTSVRGSGGTAADGPANIGHSAAHQGTSTTLPTGGESSPAGMGSNGPRDGIAPPISHEQWSHTGNLSDKAFDDLSRHFKMLEVEFASVGDNLRTISKHVMLLNEMSERVNANNSIANSNLNATIASASRFQ